MPELIYNVINREFTYLVRWDEATVTELTIKAENETAAKMKIELMSSVAGFEILQKAAGEETRIC